MAGFNLCHVNYLAIDFYPFHDFQVELVGRFVVSLAAGSDDFEVLVDGAMTVNATLKSIKNTLSLNELTKDSLVAVKV